MRLRDYHELPKFRDGLGYLYLERGKIEQTQKAIEFFYLLDLIYLTCDSFS